MGWTVRITPKAGKALAKLPVRIRETLVLLARDIELTGPVRGDWPNYGKLGPGRHHCHLKKGRPCYVAVWEERANEVRLVEITYAGTHEKAPY
jgi:hypothetical protein